jgi:hypothetical protein
MGCWIAFENHFQIGLIECWLFNIHRTKSTMLKIIKNWCKGEITQITTDTGNITPHTKAAMSTGILNLIKIKGLLSNVSLKAKQNINKDTKVLSLMVQSLQCYRQQLYFEFLESLLWKQYPFYCYLHIASVKTCTYDKSDSLIMIIDNAKYRWKKHSKISFNAALQYSTP